MQLVVPGAAARDHRPAERERANDLARLVERTDAHIGGMQPIERLLLGRSAHDAHGIFEPALVHERQRVDLVATARAEENEPQLAIEAPRALHCFEQPAWAFARLQGSQARDERSTSPSLRQTESRAHEHAIFIAPTHFCSVEHDSDRRRRVALFENAQLQRAAVHEERVAAADDRTVERDVGPISCAPKMAARRFDSAFAQGEQCAAYTASCERRQRSERQIGQRPSVLNDRSAQRAHHRQHERMRALVAELVDDVVVGLRPQRGRRTQHAACVARALESRRDEHVDVATLAQVRQQLVRGIADFRAYRRRRRHDRKLHRPAAFMPSAPRRLQARDRSSARIARPSRSLLRRAADSARASPGARAWSTCLRPRRDRGR